MQSFPSIRLNYFYAFYASDSTYFISGLLVSRSMYVSVSVCLRVYSTFSMLARCMLVECPVERWSWSTQPRNPLKFQHTHTHTLTRTLAAKERQKARKWYAFDGVRFGRLIRFALRWSPIYIIAKLFVRKSHDSGHVIYLYHIIFFALGANVWCRFFAPWKIAFYHCVCVLATIFIGRVVIIARSFHFFLLLFIFSIYIFSARK